MEVVDPAHLAPWRTTGGKCATKTKDTIPLQDYRSSTLQQIHAHSSAETSGLGDSLQRIHTLSSTETSGYGDIGSPTHSPDYGRWEHSPELGGTPADTRGDTRTDSRDRAPPDSRGAQSHLDSQTDGSRIDPRQSDRTDSRRSGSTTDHRSSEPRPDSNLRQPFQDAGPSHREQETIEQPAQKHRWRMAASSRPQTMDSMDARDSRKHPHSAMHHSGNHNHKGNVSRSGSVKSGQHNFLGADTQSTWLKWSQDRRNSFKRRLDTIEVKQAEMERNRVSTPIRKARKESVMFMPQEGKDLSFEDELEMQQVSVLNSY